MHARGNRQSTRRERKKIYNEALNHPMSDLSVCLYWCISIYFRNLLKRKKLTFCYGVFESPKQTLKSLNCVWPIVFFLLTQNMCCFVSFCFTIAILITVDISYKLLGISYVLCFFLPYAKHKCKLATHTHTHIRICELFVTANAIVVVVAIIDIFIKYTHTHNFEDLLSFCIFHHQLKRANFIFH